MSENQEGLALRVAGLRKTYGQNRVLRGVDLSVRKGEIRGLLGANGAGKSTLISCLSGSGHPDEGTIEVGGRAYESFTPREAFRAGIGVIYQHLSVIEPLSVAENIFLGEEIVHGGKVDRRRQEKEAADLLLQFGVDIDPKAAVGDLPMGERQLVEIAKMLRRKPQVLILDEPTAALSDAEAAHLADRLRDLRSNNRIGIIFVSHLMNEVFDLVDSVTVLRDGIVVLDSSIGDTSPSSVISAIAPEATLGKVRGSRSAPKARVALTVRDLSVDFVKDVSLQVHEGECVALFGLMGSGRSETVECIAGVRRPDRGELSLFGNSISPKAVAAVRAGIGFVPSDRKHHGILPGLTSEINMLLPFLSRIGPGLRRRVRERASFCETAGLVRAVPATPQIPIQRMSGGNQQKVVLGRWLIPQSNTRLLVLDEPTQGVDIGARADIYRLLSHMADHGAAVLFTSSDPDEVLQLAERVYVLSRGRIVESRPVGEFTVKSLLASAHRVDEENPASQPTNNPTEAVT